MVHAANAFLSEPECEGEAWRKHFYQALDVLDPSKAERFAEGVKLAQAQLGYLLAELQSALHADKADQKRVRLGRGVAPGRGATRSCAALFIGRRCACCPLPPEMARLRHEQQRQHAALCQLQHADTAGQPDYGLSQVCCGVCWEGALGGATLRLVQPPALALTTFQRPQPLTSALVVPAAFASAAVCRRSIR